MGKYQPGITRFFKSNKNRISKYQPNITKFFKPKGKINEIVYGYNSKTDSWHCKTCGTDMGQHNPRQYCGKYRCDYI